MAGAGAGAGAGDGTENMENGGAGRNNFSSATLVLTFQFRNFLITFFSAMLQNMDL